MPPQPEQLDHESLLMAYVLDELPPAEREAFELRVAAEPALSADLARLRAAHARLYAALEQDDATLRLPTSEAVAVRRVSREIRQWVTRRAALPAAPAARGRWRVPLWSYPAATAVALIVGFLVWSSRQEVGPMPASPEARREMEVLAAENEAVADWLSNSLAMSDPFADAELADQLAAGGGSGGDLQSIYMLPPREETSQ